MYDRTTRKCWSDFSFIPADFIKTDFIRTDFNIDAEGSSVRIKSVRIKSDKVYHTHIYKYYKFKYILYRRCFGVPDSGGVNKHTELATRAQYEYVGLSLVLIMNLIGNSNRIKSNKMFFISKCNGIFLRNPVFCSFHFRIKIEVKIVQIFAIYIHGFDINWYLFRLQSFVSYNLY